MIEVDYEKLSYGVYSFDEEDEGFGEAVKYGTAKTNLLQNMKIKLPDGKNNMLFILADSMTDTANLVKSRYFMLPPNYKTVFFPYRYIDRLLNRRVRYVLRPQDKKEYTKIMGTGTQLKPYPLKVLKTVDRNVVIPLCEIYRAAKPAIESQPIKKVYTGLFNHIKEWMDRFGSPANEKHNGDKEWNNHILMIDANSFAFERNARLKDNKSNPLYMLYFLCMRPNEMVKLNIDIDMLICSKGKFMKFNPSKMDPKSLAIFRNSLFRMMSVDLDKYTSDLNEEDKREVEEIAPTAPVEKAVDKRLAVHTKNVSPSIKAALVTKVGDKVEKKLKSKKLVDSIKRANAPTTSTSMMKSSVVTKKPIKKNSIWDTLRAKLSKLKGDDVYSPLSTFSNTLIDDESDDVDIDDYEIEDEDTPKDEVDEEIVTQDEDETENDETSDGEDEVAQYADLLNDLTDQTMNDDSVKEEIDTEIQQEIVPLNSPKAASINSKRDQKLRERQKQVRVKNSTIDEIISRDATNVKIEEVDKSKVLKTANPNMKKIKFANFNKTYINELYDKDIVAVFDSLKDKEHPFYIKSIKVEDGSTPQNYVDTWHVQLIDENGNPSTITVDIPKFINDRFMLLNGNKSIILTQNFYNPLVKDTPNEVIITTNYNKITVERTSTRSLGDIERIFSLVKKFSKESSDVFIAGNSEKANMKYVSSFEYDELSRNIFRYKSGDTELYFSRQYIETNLKNKIPEGIKGDEFYIGHQGKTPILINEDTGKDRQGRSIIQIIEETLPKNMQEAYKKIKSPKRMMYVQCKMAGEWIPGILPLIIWNGIEGALNAMDIKWKFLQGEKRIPKDDNSMDYIKFADGILAYESQIFAQLLLNGLTFLQPNTHEFSDFDTEDPYADYVKSKWGTFSGIDQIRQFNQFLVDPITKDVCRDYDMPDTPTGLIIGATKLLADNAHVSKAYDGSYRIRTIEMIPAILYGCIARQYQDYVTKGTKMTLNKNCVITKLLQEKTVENYSTLNPAIEMDKTHSISTKGYKGSNSIYSYDEQKRSYDPSAVGKLAMSTSPNAGVGINHTLVIEPTILNSRGYRDVIPANEVDNLKDVNVFAPVELLTPGTVRNDDPMRSAIGYKQSMHVVPVADAAPTLISNGFDEAVQFHLSDDFVINAEEDGEVAEVNPDVGLMTVKYKSGKTKTISLKPDIIKNSNSNFYTSNTYKFTHDKVGEKFKKDEPLAYNDKFFQYSKLNGLRYSIGPLTKVAFMSTYNTYEDAGITTEKFNERMKTSITIKDDGTFKRNDIILSMKKIGDHVNIGDALITFEESIEDDTLAKMLDKINDDSADVIEAETKNEIRATAAGKIIDIKVSTLVDPSELSPSLAKIVRAYFNKGKKKISYLNKYDKEGTIMKSGYLMTDDTEPTKNRYNQLKGYKNIDVLIEFFIEHDDVMKVGDKIAVYGPNKEIISEVIPKDWEPYSEFRPDEDIEVITSPGTVSRRMTIGIVPIAAANKVLIELKRKIKDIAKFSK